MIRELVYSKKTINAFIEPLEKLSDILSKEKEIEKMLEEKGKYDMADFIRSYPDLACEEKFIDICVESLNFSQDDLEVAITEYYKNRKAEIDGAIEKFMDSEIFQLYSDVLSLQQEYEEIICKTGEKKDTLIEYVSTELKKWLQKTVVVSSYKLFIEPIIIESINGETCEVIISIHSEWAKGTIEARFKKVIEHGIENIMGIKMRVTVVAR